MKWLLAGLTFVNCSTILGLIFGMAGHGLGKAAAPTALILGGLAAAAAFLTASEPKKVRAPVAPKPKPKPEVKLSKRAQRRLQKRVQAAPSPSEEPIPPPSPPRRRNVWLWLLGACFLIFAARSFFWLVYIDGDQLHIQSPYNRGELALHICLIKYLASGVPFWPDNPIYFLGKLRGSAGLDLFNALLYKTNVDLILGLVWVGMLASMSTFYVFRRWGGPFAAAGFLFNGGLVGFKYLTSFSFVDYQADKTIAWKSIPLSLFVTQRGLLYAIPAGVLLLWHWREKFYHQEPAVSDEPSNNDPMAAETAATVSRPPLPFWIELLLYASMPLFDVYTFVALTVVLIFFILFGDQQMRKEMGTLFVSALVPATFFLWLVTDHFHALSVLGWVQTATDEKVVRPFFVTFWFLNFGIWLPLVLTYVGFVVWRVWKTGIRWGEKLPAEITFVAAACTIFLLMFFIKTAPSGLQNTKMLIWPYFIILPFLWRDLIAEWPLVARVLVCVALFGSGFVSLFGGLGEGRPGLDFADRAELDNVGRALRGLPVESRFAVSPASNQPVLLQGRKIVMAFPGHLWSQGIGDYKTTENQLRELMQGAPNWREIASRMGVRYIFWGREEGKNYQTSTRPWEQTTARVSVDGGFGTIYDLEAPMATPAK